MMERGTSEGRMESDEKKQVTLWNVEVGCKEDGLRDGSEKPAKRSKMKAVSYGLWALSRNSLRCGLVTDSPNESPIEKQNDDSPKDL